MGSQASLPPRLEPPSGRSQLGLPWGWSRQSGHSQTRGRACGKGAGLEEQPPLSLFTQVCPQAACQEGPLLLPAACSLLAG